MNRLLVILFFSMIVFPAHAQNTGWGGLHFGMGYTYSSIKPSILNSRIKNYNSKNSLSKSESMDTINSLDGFRTQFTLVYGHHCIDWSFDIKERKTESVESTQGEPDKIMQYKIALDAMELGYSYMFVKGISLGASLELQHHTYKTRDSYDGYWDTDYSAWKFGSRFFMNFLINIDPNYNAASIIIRPYYEITPNYNIDAAASSLNARSSVGEVGNLNNFGISITLGAGGIE